MSEKSKLFSKYKMKYGIDDRKMQSYYQQAKNRNFDLERFVEYCVKMRDNKKVVIYYNKEEENIIMHAPTLKEGLWKVCAIRTEKKTKEAILKERRRAKLELLKAELKKVCEKHGAELVEGEKDILGHINGYDCDETDLDFGIKLA
jgi:hypothetical protein